MNEVPGNEAVIGEARVDPFHPERLLRRVEVRAIDPERDVPGDEMSLALRLRHRDPRAVH